MPPERRRERWVGLLTVGLARVWTRTTRTKTGRVVATVTAVAITIALLVVLTGLALALADGGAVSTDDGDVHVHPPEESSRSAIDGVETVRLGASVDRTAQLRAEPGVDHASPVLAEPATLESPDSGSSERVMLVGVQPDHESRSVAGLPTDDLETDDSLVLSSAAATTLEVDDGDDLVVPASEFATENTSAEFTVRGVEAEQTDVPVVLLDLEALHAIAGDGGDQLADRIVLWGESDQATNAASESYPEATVHAAEDTDPAAIFDDDVALATSLLALLVGLVVASAFVATTAGMTVEADRRSLAVLESVGIARSGRLTVVAVSVLSTTAVGGLCGGVLGIVGIEAVSWVATATVSHGSVAVAHPAFVPYGVVVALVAGLLALPYPLALAARTSALTEVDR